MNWGPFTSNLSLESVKRSVYLVGLPAGALAALLLFYLEQSQGTLHAVDRIGLPLLTELMLVLWMFFWGRRGRFFVLELLLFGGFSLMLLASLSYSVLQLPSGELVNLTGLGYWLSVLYTLAFLIFGVRTGLKISLGVYTLALAVWLAGIVVGPSSSAAEYTLLFQLYTANALQLLLLYGFGVLVRSQAQHAARLEQDANTDALTGLPNRRLLNARLSQEVERATRYGRTFSVVMLDLDHFKRVNDTCGHHAGDRTLREIAALLQTHGRALDTSGRWGGEEFLLLLPELTLSAAREVSERLRLRLAAHTFPHACPVTASFGVAEFSPGETLEALLERADRALYDAKETGRNRVMPERPGGAGSVTYLAS